MIAQSFQLNDALSILGLDRVLDAEPDDLELHLRALRIARAKRLDIIGTATQHLVERIQAVASIANQKMLIHSFASQKIVKASNRTASTVMTFREHLGLSGTFDDLEAHRWKDAASETAEDVWDASLNGATKAAEVMSKTAQNTRAVSSDVAAKVSGFVAARGKRGED